jgi:hypothetical protein
MRFWIPTVFVVLLVGCSTFDGEDSLPRVAQIAVATEPHCDRPAVRLDGVRLAHAQAPETLVAPYTTVNVLPGTYEIAVACQNPFNKSNGACTFWGHPNEYPTYRMPLKAGTRYTFHCYESGAELSYKITESDL